MFLRFSIALCKRGKEVAELFIPYEGVIVEIEKVGSEKGSTDIVRILIEGEDPSLPVLGVIGQQWNRARPEMIGLSAMEMVLRLLLHWL